MNIFTKAVACIAGMLLSGTPLLASIITEWKDVIRSDFDENFLSSLFLLLAFSIISLCYLKTSLSFLSALRVPA